MNHALPFSVSSTLRMAGLMLLAMAAPLAWGQGDTPLAGPARPVIEQFIKAQTSDLPGDVKVTAHTPQSGPLPACDALQPFLAPGIKAWGRILVGLKCDSAAPWTRYVPVTVSVIGTYQVAAGAIAAGQLLSPADALARQGEMTDLPAGVLLDASQLQGMQANNAIAPGAPLRRELLRGVQLVQQGQNVKVVSQGPGFVVSAQGKALTSGAAGATLQVRMPGGQVLNGTLRPDGSVERVL